MTRWVGDKNRSRLLCEENPGLDRPLEGRLCQDNRLFMDGWASAFVFTAVKGAGKQLVYKNNLYFYLSHITRHYVLQIHILYILPRYIPMCIVILFYVVNIHNIGRINISYLPSACRIVLYLHAHP